MQGILIGSNCKYEFKKNEFNMVVDWMNLIMNLRDSFIIIWALLLKRVHYKNERTRRFNWLQEIYNNSEAHVKKKLIRPKNFFRP